MPGEWKASKCVDCSREYKRRRRVTHPDDAKTQLRNWQRANPDKVKEHHRRFAEAHPDKVREMNHRYYEANQDSERAKARSRYHADPETSKSRNREWRQRNAEKVKKDLGIWVKANPDHKKKWLAAHPGYEEAYYEKNRDKILEQSKIWRQNNPEKVRERTRRHRAKKKGCVVAVADIRAVVETSGGLCAICRAYVPEGLRHIDHIIPLDKGGPHAQENLQLTCYRCNTKKSAKLPEDVIPETWVSKPNPLQPFLLNPNWK